MAKHRSLIYIERNNGIEEKEYCKITKKASEPWNMYVTKDFIRCERVHHRTKLCQILNFLSKNVLNIKKYLHRLELEWAL